MSCCGNCNGQDTDQTSKPDETQETEQETNTSEDNNEQSA